MPTKAPRTSADRFRLGYDAGLFALFVATALAQLTGVRWHEWLGAALVPAILVHLTTNWSWLVNAIKFRRAPGEHQFNRGWDLLLFVAMVVTVVSGLGISRYFLPAIGLPAREDAFWHALHETGANLTLIVLAVHLGMHLQWVARKLAAKHTG